MTDNFYTDEKDYPVPLIPMTGRERFRIIRFALYHLLACAFLAGISWLFVKDWDRSASHTFTDYLFPGFFALMALIFLVRVFRYLADWRDAEVLEYKGVILDKNWGNIINTINFSLRLQYGLDQTETFDISLKSYLRLKKGDRIILHASPRLKSVLGIQAE